MRVMNLKLVAIIIALFATLGACKKVEQSDLIIDDFRTAELTVYVRAPLNLTTAKPSNAPAGTKVVVTANYTEFGGKKGSIVKTLTVANGKISTTLKVPSKGAKYTVQPVTFEHKQIQDVEGKYLNAIFKAQPVTYTLNPETVNIEIIEYEAVSTL